jgi:hypothetical protein
MEPSWTLFYCCTGTKFPWRRMYLADLARACEAVGDTAAAAEWRSQDTIDFDEPDQVERKGP